VTISPIILPFLNIFAEGFFSALAGFGLCCIKKITSILVFGGNCGCSIRNPFLSVLSINFLAWIFYFPLIYYMGSDPGLPGFLFTTLIYVFHSAAEADIVTLCLQIQNPGTRLQCPVPKTPFLFVALLL